MRENSASRTAIVVAKAQALVGASPEMGIRLDPHTVAFADRALEIVGQGYFVRAIGYSLFRRATRIYESLMIPGLSLHQVLRKQFIERRIRAALASGTRQVIQIGAGLDSLCYRLHRDWPNVTFIEFDHPATQAVKRQLLEAMETGPNLDLNTLDLAESISKSLIAALGRQPSVIIAEGVLMYLPLERVAHWLKNIRRSCHENSRLLFTFMENQGFRKQSPAVNAWLRLAGEPFRWHVDRSSLYALLHETGWKLTNTHATWRELIGKGGAAGEWIGEARLPSLATTIPIATG